MRLRLHLTPLDGLLLLVILIWGGNFSIVKTAIEEIPAFGFNTLRMAAACLVLLTVSRLSGEAAPDRGDWPRLITLGFFGHCCYQLAFVTGLERTTVANSSLILGCMPIAVMVLNALSGRPEGCGNRQWLGVGFAVAGVYLVAGQGAGATAETLLGDALTMAALWSWAWYTTGSRALLQRYSPLQLTAYATLVGTLCYVPFGVPDLLRLDVGAVSGGAWAALVVSGLLALSVAHIIWYNRREADRERPHVGLRKPGAGGGDGGGVPMAARTDRRRAPCWSGVRADGPRTESDGADDRLRAGLTWSRTRAQGWSSNMARGLPFSDRRGCSGEWWPHGWLPAASGSA